MTRFTPAHLDLVLAQILRSPTLAEMAFKHLESANLVAENIGGRPIHAVVYEVIRRSFTEYGHTPDEATLRVEVGTYLDKYYPEPAVQAQILNELQSIIVLQSVADQRGEQLARSIIQYIVKVEQFQPAARTAAEEAIATGQYGAMVGIIQQLESGQNGINGGKSVNNILSIDLKQRGERILTHVPWLDQRLGHGRGPVVGCMMVLIMPQGVGKCLGKGTTVRLYDGSVKLVEDVVAGDRLMGPDSQPRTVMNTTRGRGQMYTIKPRWLDSFVCNDVHVLTLINVDTHKIIDIPLDEYLAKGAWFKERHKLFRAAVDYPEQPVSIDPYVVGAWLGDGTKENGSTNITKNDDELLDYLCAYAVGLGLTPLVRTDPRNGVKTVAMSSGHSGGVSNVLRSEFKRCITPDGQKYIPREYMVNTRTSRLRLLAGLIDTDGHVAKPALVEIVSKYDRLASDIVELALSLGFNVTRSIKRVNDVDYHRIIISGDFTGVPCLIPRKQAQKIVQARYRGNRSKFDVVAMGEDDYYGFELDGDGRFLLGDFTVTHNTSLGMNLCVNQALAGKDALLVLAEEGLSASVQQKIKGCALGVDYSLFDTMTIEEVFVHCKLNPILSRQKLQKIQDHLFFLDMAGGVGGTDEIIAEISSLESRGRKPIFVYVDWAGFIVNRLTTVTSGKINKEAALKTMSYALADAAVKFNNIVCVAQQMAGEAVKNGSTAHNDHYCASDCKGFTEPAKYVIVVNPKHEKIKGPPVNVCNIAKARDDAKPERFVIRLKGEMSTFVDVSADYTITGTKSIAYNKATKRNEGATVDS